MAPTKDSTPGRNETRGRGLGITKHLLNMATPLRSSAMRQLLQASLPAFSKPIGASGQPKQADEKKKNDLSNWMRSIKSQAKAALDLDESLEAETELEIEKSRQEEELDNSDSDSPPTVESFEQLGKILYMHSRKRSFGSFQHHVETPFEKRQRMNKVGEFFGY